MSAAALYVTLRVPDPSALTALGALSTLLPTPPTRLERARVWHAQGGASWFSGSLDAWRNPNKERALPWLEGQESRWPGGPGQAWVWVRDRKSNPEGHTLRGMREAGLTPPTRLVQGTVWLVDFPEGEDALELAAQAAEVRSAHRGLLANPHAQVFEIGSPPRSIEAVGMVLSRLEAAAR